MMFAIINNNDMAKNAKGRRSSKISGPSSRRVKKVSSADSVPNMVFGARGGKQNSPEATEPSQFRASTGSVRRANRRGSSQQRRRVSATSTTSSTSSSCCDRSVATAPTLSLDESGHTVLRNRHTSLDVSSHSTNSHRVAVTKSNAPIPPSAKADEPVDLDFAMCESILTSWGKAKSSSNYQQLGQTFLFHLAQAEPLAYDILEVDRLALSYNAGVCQSLITVMDDMTMLLGPMLDDEETFEQLRSQFEQLKFSSALLAVLPESYCSALKELLGDQDFTQDVEGSWTKFLTWVASHKTFFAMN